MLLKYCFYTNLFFCFAVSQYGNKNKNNNDIIDIDGGYFFYGGYKNKDSELRYVPAFKIYNHKVTNKEYREVLNWCKANKRDEDFKFLQIRFKLKNKDLEQYGINEDYLKNYFSNEKYNDYPVVCTNYSQKIKYCELQTIRTGLQHRLLHDYEMEFLLSEAECVNEDGDIKTHQSKTFDENRKKNNVKDYDPAKYYNIKTGDSNKYKNQRQQSLNYSHYKRYEPSKHNIYDLMGNVFVQCLENYNKKGTQKVAKGAAFYTDYTLCATENKEPVNVKDNRPDVGFYCVIETA